MLGPWPCSLRTPPPPPVAQCEVTPEAGHAGGPHEEGRKTGIRPSRLSLDCRVEGFCPLALRSCVFSVELDLLLSRPDSFTFPPAPSVLSKDDSRTSLASTPTCSLGSRPGFPASSRAYWGTLQKPQTLAIPGLSSSHFSECPPREGERQGGREGEREGLLTGPTAALPLEGASPRFYPERHHQKPVPNEVLPN